MSVYAIWDNAQHTVIRYEFDGRWTWDEFYMVLEQVKGMLDTVPHMVDFIMNSTSDYVPPSFITHFGKIWQEVHPRAGTVLIVSSSGFAKAMYGVVHRLYPAFAGRNVLVPSVEAARGMIGQVMYS